MRDPFAIFGMEPRPWIDLDVLRESFNQKAAVCHPDSNLETGTSGKFLDLNTAYQTLRDPVSRLRCLLELSGTIPQREQRDSNPVPQELVALFAEIAPIKAALRDFLRQRSTVKSPLALALLKNEEQKLIAATAILEKKLHHHWQSCEESLQALNQQWSECSPTLLLSANTLATKMKFLQKWMASLKIESLESTDPAAIPNQP